MNERRDFGRGFIFENGEDHLLFNSEVGPCFRSVVYGVPEMSPNG